MAGLSPEDIRALRKAQRLHPQTEERLRQLLAKARLDGYALPEGWGLAGSHRSDLVAYLHDRGILHFEVFASAGNVHRDVNILLMSQADVKVALLIDEEVDPRVAESYFRVVADNRFHWYWLSVFLDLTREEEAVHILEYLLAEAAQVGGPLLARPMVSVQPPVGAPFSRFAVRVAGFHPDRDVTVYWDPDGITTVLAMARRITAAGTGECEAFVPHGGIATPGQHTVRAVDSLGNVATTKFDVAPAWPAPSVRAVPSEARPGEVISVVGGGAPAHTELTVFLWREHQGWGVSKVTSDKRGEFASPLKIPWLLGSIELVKPGRCKLSLSPTEGGPSFEVHTYMTILPFSPPGVLEWQSGTSHKSSNVALLESHFRVSGEMISVSLTIRNDRDDVIVLVPAGYMTIIEITPELREKGYAFECTAATSARLAPDAEVAASFEFRRTFTSLPADLFPPMRVLHLVLPVLSERGGPISLRAAETFPLEVWAG